MVPRPPVETFPWGTHRLYESRVVCIGATRCPPHHAWCADLEPIRRHVFVFPTAPVWVERAGEEPYVADANRVLFHAEGDEIRRRSVDERGAAGHWFAIGYDHLLPSLERWSQALIGRCPGPFRLRHGPCSLDVFRRQDLLVRELVEGKVEPLHVDETALALTEDVLTWAYGRPAEPRPTRSSTHRRHARLVEEVMAWFATGFRSSSTLAEISAAVGASPFHLARVFRAHTGMSLHAYRNQLRLRAATQAILEGEENLADLALRLGFASHSHLTDTFRAAYGFPPRVLRRRARSVCRR